MTTSPRCLRLVRLVLELRGRRMGVADRVAGRRRGRARRAGRLLDDGGRHGGRGHGQYGGDDDAAEGLHGVLSATRFLYFFFS